MMVHHSESYSSTRHRVPLFPGCLNLSIVQHNCLGSSNVFQTLFSFFIITKIPLTLFLFRIFPCGKTLHLFFRIINVFFPLLLTFTSCVLLYMCTKACLMLFLYYLCFLIGWTLWHSPEELFDSSHKLFRLYNAYSVASGHTRSVAPIDLFPLHVFPTLVVGDLNIHHSLSDPERFLTNNEAHISAPYFTKASDNSFSLLNIPGVFTRFPFTSPTDRAFSTWP